MKRIAIKQIRYFVVAFIVLFFFGGRPIEFGEETVFFHGYLIPKPVIKIGLAVDTSDIHIRSSSGMKVYEVGKDYELIADDVGELRIKGRKEKLSEKFVLLVGQAKDREEAEQIARDLKTKINNAIYVEEDPEFKLNGLFLVKVGDFLTRGDALNFITTLNSLGVRDAWILREEVVQGGSKPLWLMINDALRNLGDEAYLYFIPSNPQSYLSLNSRPYRGIITLKATSRGVVVVNILNLEDYLKSVVPGELSPSSFGELEALKAQAVAARTYAIKNLGQYKDKGFDILDTPQSQVYSGMGVESPLSNRAVEETRGQVSVYGGHLIDALYTSTCGGRTEDSDKIFGGQPLPYLKSTDCIYDRPTEWTLVTKLPALPVRLRGADFSQPIAALISLDVLPSEADPAFWTQEANLEEAINWLKNALALLGRKQDKFPPEIGPLNSANWASLLVGAFQWQDRIDNLLLPSEVEFLMKDFPEIKGPGRNAVAYLIQAGILPAGGPVGRLDSSLTRGELASSLYKSIFSIKDLYHHGIFRGMTKGKVEFGEEFERRQVVLSPHAFLLRNLDGLDSFATRLSLLGGEEMRWLEKDDTIRLLDVTFPPDTNILDRSSKLHRWHARKSREELEAKISQYYPIGQLVDLVVHKRGASHRVIQLLVKGAGGQFLVEGLKIRWVLGLKDTLFVIDRERDEEGKISHFTFSGRGWGHGVGLCQVGAFGMAQAGAKYEEILKKYYHGTKIDKIY